MATETLSYVHGKFKDKIIVRTPFEEMSNWMFVGGLWRME